MDGDALMETAAAVLSAIFVVFMTIVVVFADRAVPHPTQKAAMQMTEGN